MEQSEPRGTLRIGRIAGVPVDVHWSVLAIVALIATGLGAGQLPAVFPGYPGWGYAVAGIGAAVVFWLGLLAHEAAHAVVAIRHGLPVEGITLWVLGGVSRLRGEAQDPRTEVRIAAAGPLVSLALGLGFGMLGVVLAASGVRGLVLGAVAWLSGINLALVVFNILPAAPLDGGRLLRAALWRWRGDRQWAAIVSARAGRVLGTILLVLGLWEFLIVSAVGGLWLAVLGWFLMGAATVEEQQVVVGQALKGVRVSQLMSRNPDSVPADLSVADFLQDHLFRHRFSSFPLMSEGHPVGLVTTNQIKAVPEQERDRVRLRDIGCTLKDVPVTDPETEVSELLPDLAGCAEGRALVVDHGDLVGIVTPSDIARAVEHASLTAGHR